MVTTNRDRLAAMFRELRGAGLVARQNFGCCGGCAAAELGEMARASGRLGVVYYHRQDAARLRPTRWRRNPAESVYVGFGSVVEDRYPTSRDIGREVVAAAARAGLATVWDGSAGQRIAVLLPGGIDAPAEEAAR